MKTLPRKEGAGGKWRGRGFTKAADLPSKRRQRGIQNREGDLPGGRGDGRGGTTTSGEKNHERRKSRPMGTG